MGSPICTANPISTYRRSTIASNTPTRSFLTIASMSSFNSSSIRVKWSLFSSSDRIVGRSLMGSRKASRNSLTSLSQATNIFLLFQLIQHGVQSGAPPVSNRLVPHYKTPLPLNHATLHYRRKNPHGTITPHLPATPLTNQSNHSYSPLL